MAEQTTKEQQDLEALMEVARAGIFPPGWGAKHKESANEQMGAEYLDLAEFLEGELGVGYWQQLMLRFYAQQAKRNLEGMADAGYPLRFTSEEARENVLKLIEQHTK